MVVCVGLGHTSRSSQILVRGTLLIEGLQTLVYTKPDHTQEEVIKEESIKDDIGIIEAFSSQWQVELDEVDEEDHGHHVQQRVEVDVGEAKEVKVQPMVDISKEVEIEVTTNIIKDTGKGKRATQGEEAEIEEDEVPPPKCLVLIHYQGKFMSCNTSWLMLTLITIGIKLSQTTTSGRGMRLMPQSILFSKSRLRELILLLLQIVNPHTLCEVFTCNKISI